MARPLNAEMQRFAQELYAAMIGAWMASGKAMGAKEAASFADMSFLYAREFADRLHADTQKSQG